MKESNKGIYLLLIGSLCLFAFTLPLSKSISSITMGLIYAASFGMLAFDRQLRMSTFHSLRQPLNLPIGLYVSVLCLGLLFSQDVGEGISVVKQAANLFFVYLMVSTVLDALKNGDKHNLHGETVLFSFLMGIFALDIIGFLTFGGIIGDKKNILPVTPLGMHHIWFGNLNVIGLLGASSLLLFSAGQMKSFQRVALWLFILSAPASLLISTSRTAWLGALLAVSIFLYYVIRKKRTFFFLSFFLFACCVAAYFLSDIVQARIDRVSTDIALFISGDPNTSLGARFTMWQASVTMFLSNPLIGVGTGDYKQTISAFVVTGQYPGILGKFNQPHNIYLFALATNGIIGISALLFIFYRIFRQVRLLLHGRQRGYGILAMAVSVHFLTAGLTESLFNIHVLISSFAFVMGVCLRKSLLSAQND